VALKSRIESRADRDSTLGWWRTVEGAVRLSRAAGPRVFAHRGATDRQTVRRLSSGWGSSTATRNRRPRSKDRRRFAVTRPRPTLPPPAGRTATATVGLPVYAAPPWPPRGLDHTDGPAPPRPSASASSSRQAARPASTGPRPGGRRCRRRWPRSPSARCGTTGPRRCAGRRRTSGQPTNAATSAGRSGRTARRPGTAGHGSSADVYTPFFAPVFS
jgi:hypothetical protein